MVQAGFPTGQRGQTDEALALGSVFHMGLSCPSVTLGHLSCCPPPPAWTPLPSAGLWDVQIPSGEGHCPVPSCPVSSPRKQRQAQASLGRFSFPCIFTHCDGMAGPAAGLCPRKDALPSPPLLHGLCPCTSRGNEHSAVQSACDRSSKGATQWV